MIYNSQKRPCLSKGGRDAPWRRRANAKFSSWRGFCFFYFQAAPPPLPPTTPSSDLIRIVTRSYFKGEGGFPLSHPRTLLYLFCFEWFYLLVSSWLFFHYDFCHSSYSFPWFFLHFLFFIVFFFHAYLKSLKYASAPVWLSNDLLRVSYFVCYLFITDFGS